MTQIQATGEKSIHYLDLMNQNQASMEAEEIPRPVVEDLPDDLDWDTWGGNAVCFCLVDCDVFKIYTVNPNDCSCYHLADFPFADNLRNSLLGRHSTIASCTMIGSRLYLIGRTNPKQHLSTKLWIWDVSQAQKMKNKGERYEWKLGPPLNSAKDQVLAFSLGGDLYALDISREFEPPINGGRRYNSSKDLENNPHDFECLKTSLYSGDHLLPWVPMPPLQVQTYVALMFAGCCCVGDSRFLLHMVNLSDDSLRGHHFFCFDVNTKEWVRHLFSGLPLIPDVHEHSYLSHSPIVCLRYTAQVQNHGLFIHPFTGKISVFDFSPVFDLIKKPGVCRNSFYQYPYFSLNVDESNVLKEIHDCMVERIDLWHTVHVADKRFCCIALFYVDNMMQVWICSLDLEQKPKRRNGSKKKNKKNVTFSARNDVEKLWIISNNQLQALPIN